MAVTMMVVLMFAREIVIIAQQAVVRPTVGTLAQDIVKTIVMDIALDILDNLI